MKKNAPRKIRATAKPICPLLSANATAKLCGFTAHRVRQLEREGWFGKKGRDRYDPIEVLKGYVRFLQDDARRASKSAAATDLQSARTREIEQRIAREDGRLIPIEEVQAGIADILGTYRSELSGIAAASSRDLGVRNAIESNLDRAIDRCRARFEAMQHDLRSGSEVKLDGDEGDDE